MSNPFFFPVSNFELNTPLSPRSQKFPKFLSRSRKKFKNFHLSNPSKFLIARHDTIALILFFELLDIYMYICTQKTECFNATRNRKQKHDSDTISHRQRTADDWGINYVFRISRISPLFHARDCALTLTTALKHSLNDFINSTCKYLLRITRLTLSFLLTSIFFTIWQQKTSLLFKIMHINVEKMSCKSIIGFSNKRNYCELLSNI